ncbi:alpha/beta hydrolase [Amnibacterium setariae]|uniref:alpha/beta hydrolase n=1 Tax=Amnibacterium setariae TaxID=2306585 RepID=UPI0018F5B59C|nr:alpha/beta hydrolase [Amnibacterium setariae]
MARPTLFLLHALGLSARSWDGVIDAIGDGLDVVALDLPGYGDNAASPLLTVRETAEWVAARIREREPDEWLIAGHSMGGKIATIVTAWAERAEHGLIPPTGLVLVDASTPGPEPMAEERRALMEQWWASGTISAEDAAAYIHANTAGPIPGAVRETAIADVQRSSRVAWLEWLRRGSLEDWSDEVGVLRTPTAIVVGAEDPDLGAVNQERLNLPHVPNAVVHEVDGAGHDSLLQYPGEVARFVTGLAARVEGTAALPPAFARLIASDRVSARTRRVMMRRLDGPGDAPRVFSPAQRALLTVLVARVLPQRGTDLDIAGRIDAEFAAGHGDGWRFAELPPDAEAWRQGLDTLAEQVPDFAALTGAAQEAVLDRVWDGGIGSDADGRLTGSQMRLWLKDVQAEAVRMWLSHPAAQAWIRYDGFADGGDGPRKQGFSTTHAGEWEPWQRDWRTGKELQA